MKKLLSVIAMTLLAGALYAGPIDGKWRAEFKIPEGKGGKRGGGTVVTLFDLKSDGSTLAGSITMSRGRRDRTTEIQNGKIEGGKFTFTTVQQGRNGEAKIIWEGTVTGDELTGTRAREGRRRGREFTARRL
ncbi:MAG TPA: hypothetical protein VM120_29530 [Bryobacteraceae bacterium]|nr:hypothetical protein [Bryobacteraceae bacterium]